MNVGAIYRQNNKRQTLVPCKGGGFSDGRLTPCTTRGGINYRKWEKIKADKKASRAQTPKQTKEKQIVQQVAPGAYECAQTYLIPINEIFTDTQKFQQREKEFSPDSVNKIINAVQTGTFRWQVLDPVLLWQSPTGKLFVLSGHSRLETFHQLAQQGTIYDNRDFNRIPARIIDVPENEAIRIALMSNTLATPESPAERAVYYRSLLKSGTPAKEVEELAKVYEAKNAGAVLAYAYLNPNGLFFDMLRRFQNSDATSRKQAENLAQFAGEARRRFPMLTNEHERELWEFMNSPEGQKAIKGKSDFLSAVSRAIDNNTEFGVFEQDKPLNILRRLYKQPAVQEYEKQLNELRRQIENKLKEREAEFNRYLKLGYNTTQINPILINYDNQVAKLRREYAEMIKKRKTVESEGEKQTALFGIGAINRRLRAPSCAQHYLTY